MTGPPVWNSVWKSSLRRVWTAISFIPCFSSIYETCVDPNISQCCLHTAGATGSIPVPPTIKNKALARLPQDLLSEFGTVGLAGSAQADEHSTSTGMGSECASRRKNRGVLLGIFACLLSVSAPSNVRASPDPCQTGYWSGSKRDIEACAALAKAGGPNAEFGYALILWSGHNSAEDHKAALDWFRKSARQGHYLAQVSLGRFLSNPSTDKELRSAVEAYAWWTAAGATKSASKQLATLTPSDARRAEKLGKEYKAKYAGQRPSSNGP
jgi:TPR repeat protein